MSSSDRMKCTSNEWFTVFNKYLMIHVLTFHESMHIALNKQKIK